MVGRTLGHYRLLEQLGAGGMGEVYLASDLTLGRRVAIKLPQARFLQTAAGRARFLREARTTAALNHPNIAVLYEVAESESGPYLAMEYVEGRCLGDELQGGPLSEERLLRYIAQIASAVEHAHGRGVLHRDIKPANILLTTEGVLKLLDFGLAKFAQAEDETRSLLTAPGVVVGTLHYLAPEVLSGREADARSDLYSLGVVMYEMASGQRPYAGLEGARLVGGILQGAPAPVRQRNAAVSPEVASVIEQAMAVLPEARFQSATDLLAAVRRLEGGAARGLTPGPEAAAAVPVLAILGFENLSGDPTIDWLGTGMAETLSADLKKLEKVRVVARERVVEALRRCGGRIEGGPPLEEISRELGARWVVTGGYQRAGDRLRITPRLIDMHTGEITATAKVDGNWQEVFALQDRVVADLMASLEVDMDSAAFDRIAPPETLHLEAYEQYSRGRKEFDELGKTSLDEARRRFERAIALDPRYAAAHSALGATYAMRFIVRTDPDDLARSAASLERALELDPELGEPYPYLCYVYMRLGRMAQAISAGRKAVQHQPDLVQAHYFLGAAHMLNTEVHPEDYQAAAEALLDATEADLRWEPNWLGLAAVALMVGDHERGARFAAEALTLERQGTGRGHFVGAGTLLGSTRLRQGRWAEARQEYEQAIERASRCDHMYREAFLALSACGLGDIDLREGRAEAALADYRRAWHTVTEFPRMLGNERVAIRTMAGMAAAYAASGQRPRAQELARDAGERLEAVQLQTWIWDAARSQLWHALAVAWLRLGDRGRALDCLEKASEQGWRDGGWLETDPELAALREEPRFQALVAALRRAPAITFRPAGRVAAS